MSFILNTNPPIGPRFATGVSANGYYLVDQYGAPFLVVGDSPQPLMTNLSLSDAATYFANRAAAGFNTLWLDAITDLYVSGVNGNAQTTYDGIAPFTTAHDLSTPNPTYWARIDAMLQEAAAAGITVFVGTCETGPGSQCLSDADTSGSTKCYGYGQFLGNRYWDYPNIVWAHGNDFNTAPDLNINQISLGISSTPDRHLQSVELGDNAPSCSTDDTGTGSWSTLVQLNWAYTYCQTYAEVLNAYNQTAVPRMPTFLGESNYENMDNGASGTTANTRTMLMQMWWTMTSGVTGYFYGSSYFDLHSGWQTGINTTAVTQLTYMTQFFNGLPWFNLVPDQSHTFVTAGYGTYNGGTGAANDGTKNNGTYVTAAVDPLGTTGVAYCPVNTTLTVAMTKMGGPTTAYWYDPTNNTYTTVGTYANTGTQTFSRSTNNSAGNTDWVLLLTAP